MIIHSNFIGTERELRDHVAMMGARILAYAEEGVWVYSAAGPLPDTLEEVTLTIDREDNTLFVVLTLDDGEWKLRSARDENGKRTFPTLEEFKALRLRAEEGENEGGF